MSKSKKETGHQERLRRDAEARLKGGNTPPAISAPASVDALIRLHKLASHPDTAADALKLLHELQVHQVELDLQHRQQDANERDLTDALDRYRTLFDFAPIVYLIVDFNGDISEANRAAAELLGVGEGNIMSYSIDSLVAPESRPILAELLQELRKGGSGIGSGIGSVSGSGLGSGIGSAISCEVKLANNKWASRLVQVTASVSPGGESVLMAITGVDRAHTAV